MTITRLLLVLLLCHIPLHWCQIADPVRPYYSYDQIVKTFNSFPVPDFATIEIMKDRMALESHEHACLNNADKPGNSINKWRSFDEAEDNSPYLHNTTYWFNEFLHVGHVHYDIVLMQVLQTEKVDRIIIQRPACHAKQCVGIGSIDSFYKGYFAALFKAFHQSNIPVYIRWSWKDKIVNPIFFSAESPDYYNESAVQNLLPSLKSIKLKHTMCFDRVIKRVPADYGFTPLVSTSAVQAFKSAAYDMINTHNANNSTAEKLVAFFEDKAPYRILFAYRSSTASRFINNMPDFVQNLTNSFPAPAYQLRLLDTSDIHLDFQTQLQAVAESNVVISNHGAFEANMIYMRNSSLLIEIFGHYGNNEIHTFHRLALVFGLYYARVHARNMTTHLQRSFTMSAGDTGEVVEIMQEYFGQKRYLRYTGSERSGDSRASSMAGSVPGKPLIDGSVLSLLF